MAGSYCVPVSPTSTPGFLVRPESRILVGNSALYGSLDNSSWAYQTYEASVCLRAGTFQDVGLVADLKWSHKPKYEAIDSVNVATATVYDVMGDETTLTVEMQEWHPEIINIALGTGVGYDLTTEWLFTFGDGCDIKNRPICIQSTNQSCNAPDTENIDNGVSGLCLTLYDTICTSGIEAGLSAKAINTLPLEFTCRPVLARAAGNRLGSLSMY